MVAVTIFCLAYLGIAVGKIPGLRIDRVGLALLGAIAMVVFGVLSPENAVRSIDLPTILLLYSLMIVSAQLRLGGFYTWIAMRIIPFYTYPRRFLMVTMVASAALSAILANDIVCLAFTPVLAQSLLRVKLNPLPFLLGLAISSNIGSAATIIGNPQNMLIGQTGHLDFAYFFFWCAPPTIAALLAAYLLIVFIFRNRFTSVGQAPLIDSPHAEPVLNRWQSLKGIIAILILITLFFTPIPREISAIAIAGLLLCSREMRSKDIIGLVDWHLITLFCALFVINDGIAQSGFLQIIMTQFSRVGINLQDLSILSGVSVIASNLFSNVPATMLLIGFIDPLIPAQWYTLAVSSTFAGNLFLLGSIANLIVIEQAATYNIKISFSEHARIGIPVTIVSLVILLSWLVFV
ncbi:MAG: anion transporter [Calditrichales bacterium]|nr:MAG: anion transporter [Calditrichales bacterium]